VGGLIAYIRVKQFAEHQFIPERIGKLMLERIKTIVGVN
jgi:hypothetical protein